MKTSEKEGKIGKYRLCILCKVQIQKQEKIYMQHKKNMQCNNNWFRFIYSFNVRDAREKNSQSKIHKCNFFWEENCLILQSFWVLKSIYIFVILGHLLGYLFCQILRFFVFLKYLIFIKKKLLSAFFENSLKKSFGIWSQVDKLRRNILRKKICDDF